MYCPYCGSNNVECSDGTEGSDYLACGDCNFIGNVYEDIQAMEEEHNRRNGNT